MEMFPAAVVLLVIWEVRVEIPRAPVAQRTGGDHHAAPAGEVDRDDVLAAAHVRDPALPWRRCTEAAAHAWCLPRAARQEPEPLAHHADRELILWPLEDADVQADRWSGVARPV